MAAPGFSITELVEVCHLAWTYTIKIKNAPKEFGSFTAEIGSLGSTLKTLERVASKEGSLYKRAERSDRQELHDVLEKCLKTLAELENLLLKYYPMLDKESRKRFWSQIRWTRVDPQSLRNKLGMYTSSIGIFMSALTHSSLSRIEAATGMRDGEFGRAWIVLGQELEQGGVTALDLLKRRPEIVGQIQRRGGRSIIFDTDDKEMGVSTQPSPSIKSQQKPESSKSDNGKDNYLPISVHHDAEIEVQSMKRMVKRLEEEVVKLKNDLKQEIDISNLAQKQLYTDREMISMKDSAYRTAFREVLGMQGYPRVRIADLMEEFNDLVRENLSDSSQHEPKVRKLFGEVPISTDGALNRNRLLIPRESHRSLTESAKQPSNTEDAERAAAKRLAEGIVSSISTPEVQKFTVETYSTRAASNRRTYQSTTTSKPRSLQRTKDDLDEQEARQGAQQTAERREWERFLEKTKDLPSAQRIAEMEKLEKEIKMRRQMEQPQRVARTERLAEAEKRMAKKEKYEEEIKMKTPASAVPKEKKYEYTCPRPGCGALFQDEKTMEQHAQSTHREPGSGRAGAVVEVDALLDYFERICGDDGVDREEIQREGIGKEDGVDQEDGPDEMLSWIMEQERRRMMAGSDFWEDGE